MSHDKVVGFCEPNKCKVEVPNKEDFDTVADTVDSLFDSTADIKSKSITNSGTITSTGKITANGGIAGTLTGNVTGHVTGNVKGLLFVKGTIRTSGDVTYASCSAQTIHNADIGSEPLTFTVGEYTISYNTPVRHTYGVYTRESDLTWDVTPNFTTRTCTITHSISSSDSGYARTQTLYYKKSTDSSYKSLTFVPKNSTTIATLTLDVGATYNIYSTFKSGITSYTTNELTVNIPAGTTYKVKYATP